MLNQINKFYIKSSSAKTPHINTYIFTRKVKLGDVDHKLANISKQIQSNLPFQLHIQFNATKNPNEAIRAEFVADNLFKRLIPLTYTSYTYLRETKDTHISLLYTPILEKHSALDEFLATKNIDKA